MPSREGVDVGIEIDYSKIRDCEDVKVHESIDISKRAILCFASNTVFCDT